jgi:hypothetical protein
MLFVLTFHTPSPLLAGDKVLEMNDLREGDLVVDGFTLKTNTPLEIYAVGARTKLSDDLYAYAWILDSDSREDVWIMTEENTKRFKGNKSCRVFDDEVTLPAGSYEVYYHVGQPFYAHEKTIILDEIGDAIDILGYIFDEDEGERYTYYSEEIDELRLIIKAPEGSFTKFSPSAESEKMAILDYTKAEDDIYVEKGFRLEKELSVKIVAIGEYISRDRFFVDHGWIINADSREKIWEMDKWNTSWAGGGRKNRGCSEIIELPAGNYMAYYVTDDSHAFGSWNFPPPFDPLHYGMAIYAVNDDDRQYIKEYEDTLSEPLLLSITRVRDDQFKQKGFRLKEETNLHILALGEYGYMDEFVDFGWIEDLETDEIVWEMTGDNTSHAGGAKKNRKFDGIVTLPAGDYVVYYISDGSHSYRDWNETSPHDKEKWGITIFGSGSDFNEDDVAIFDDIPESSNILVRLTGVGDDEEVRQRFELEEPGKVQIYALGEGSGGDMFDYAWIEEVGTGDIIWEMTYRKTDYAGGAKKNREIETTIYLDAGEYYAYYITDGSHSFPDFNASSPKRPQKWGITVSLK